MVMRGMVGIPREGGMVGAGVRSGGVGGVKKKADIDQIGGGRTMAHATLKLAKRRVQEEQGAEREEGGILDIGEKMSLGGKSGGGRDQTQDMR